MYTSESTYGGGFRKFVEDKLKHIPIGGGDNYYIYYKEDVPVLLREIDRLKKELEEVLVP